MLTIILIIVLTSASALLSCHALVRNNRVSMMGALVCNMMAMVAMMSYTLQYNGIGYVV